MSPELREKVSALFDWFDRRDCAIAFSGGVDSATLAKALVLATSERPLWTDERGVRRHKIAPVGYFATSETTTSVERLETPRVAKEIGLELRTFGTLEFSDPNFVANTPRRCYWCKKVRFAAIKERIRTDFGAERPVFLLDGSNADDARDFRPGSQAGREIGVLSPFAELGFTKSDIRELARIWSLTVAEKPSNPCLATRVAYDMTLNDDILRKIERAEIVLKELLGVSSCRARVDAVNAVRLEVPEASIERAVIPQIRAKLVAKMREIGFVFVSLDLEGFYTGKNNLSLTSRSDVDVRG